MAHLPPLPDTATPATPAALSSLDAQALSARLASLASEERATQVDFIRLLAELDRRRGYAELGYPSLWEYCLRALHLREGAAARRIGAMRVLRRFPALEPALRDGRLCLSTLRVLEEVLTDENVSEVLADAAFKSSAEVQTLVAARRPRPAPADGLRRIGGSGAAGTDGPHWRHDASPHCAQPAARDGRLRPLGVRRCRASPGCLSPGTGRQRFRAEDDDRVRGPGGSCRPGDARTGPTPGVPGGRSRAVVAARHLRCRGPGRAGAPTKAPRPQDPATRSRRGPQGGNSVRHREARQAPRRRRPRASSFRAGEARGGGEARRHGEDPGRERPIDR